MAKQTPAIVHVPTLVAPVKKIVSAFASLDKAQSKLGDTVLEVAPTIAADNIEPFCAMLKARLEEASPDKAGSIKTQVSYIRRVVTAIVVDGVTVEPGQSLRGLYDSLPKKETGAAAHAKRGAKLPNPAEDGEADAPAKAEPSSAEKRAQAIRDAITTLFGYCEPDLIAAAEYATANASVFVRWAQASARAAQLAEIEKVVAAVPAKAGRGKRQSADVVAA